MIAFLRRTSVFRWLVYLAILLPAMLLREVCLGLRTGFDCWCVLVQQHEAGWKKRKAGARIERDTIDWAGANKALHQQAESLLARHPTHFVEPRSIAYRQYPRGSQS